MNSVAAYGLSIQSEIPLLEAPPARTGPQVLVRLGKVEKPAGSEAGQGYAADKDRFRVYWRGVGTFSIANGSMVVVEPERETEEAVLRLYLLGPVLGVLLHQRGYLVLHSSVVSIDGAGVAFIGEKGWGKSTTAAAFNVRGHNLLADDVMAVLPQEDGPPLIQPGLPHFKLWPEAAAASFGDDPSTLVRLHSKVEKRIREAKGHVEPTPVPLRRIYLLGAGTRLEAVPLTPAAALMALVRHSYLSRVMQVLGGTQENFVQCSRLARQVPMRRLLRASDLNALGDIVRLVEAETLAEGKPLRADVFACA
jgi:hypothetical protein